MSKITPNIASKAANIVYSIRQPSERGEYRLFGAEANAVSQYFDFDLSNGPIKGISGGLISHLFNRTTGFAMIGKGKGIYRNDHIVSIRGTDIFRDWLTNGNVGITGSDNGAAVHAGFNKTFKSMKPAFENYFSKQSASAGGTIHCVGHSLGGALASLTADWLKTSYSFSVNLYTFGAPRVGLQGFSNKTTSRLNNIYRCTHGADPVPKVPLWPFTHAPFNGTEFRLNSGQGISPSAHKMGADGSPGYVNSASSDSWDALQKKSDNFLTEPVRLEYEKRHNASFSAYWADRITAALVTLLKDAGYYAAILAQATIGTALTFYDLLARTLVKVVHASAKFAAQTAGLIGHMMVFAGLATVRLGELTYEFIKWVFDKTLAALYRSVREAISSNH